MLTEARVEHILARIPELTVGVVGDLFLDRYLDIDSALTEPSIETGLDAYQVTRVRSYPGAAGTVINNLVALGVKRVCAVSVVGDDGEGYELRKELAALRGMDSAGVISAPDRRTPTYTKPMLHETGQPPRELNRLDIKTRTPLPLPAQDLVLAALSEVWPQVDTLLVLDQVSEAECGVITTRVRELLAQIGESSPLKFVLADSRERIRAFRFVSLKPNERECRQVLGTNPLNCGPFSIQGATRELAKRAGRPAFCTNGAQGIILATPPPEDRVIHVPGYPVTGPIDTVGAGDSTSAAIACAVATGATLEEAAAFGNLVASITIQQLGTTGTASPAQVRRRWREVAL